MDGPDYFVSTKWKAILKSWKNPATFAKHIEQTKVMAKEYISWNGTSR